MVEPELNVSEKVCRRSEQVPPCSRMWRHFLREVVRWRMRPNAQAAGRANACSRSPVDADRQFIGLAFSPRLEHSLQTKQRIHSPSQRNVDQL